MAHGRGGYSLPAESGLAGFLPGYLAALLASFGKANCNRLLAVLDATSLSSLSRFESAMFSPAHCALD